MSTEYERIAGVINATPEERDRLRRLAESMAPTLPDFLLARIAEDEERARIFEHDQALAQNGTYGRGGLETYRIEWSAAKRYGWVPARVLAECEAKRRIVDWHRLIDGLDTEDNPVRGCGSCIASGAEPPYIIAGPCLTVRLLALPYADHPDYREQWKP